MATLQTAEEETAAVGLHIPTAGTTAAGTTAATTG